MMNNKKKTNATWNEYGKNGNKQWNNNNGHMHEGNGTAVLSTKYIQNSEWIGNHFQSPKCTFFQMSVLCLWPRCYAFPLIGFICLRFSVIVSKNFNFIAIHFHSHARTQFNAELLVFYRWIARGRLSFVNRHNRILYVLWPIFIH